MSALTAVGGDAFPQPPRDDNEQNHRHDLADDDGDHQRPGRLLVQGAGGDAADERADPLHRGEQPVRGGPPIRSDEIGDQRLDRGVLQADGRSPQQDAGGDGGEPAGEDQRRYGGDDDGQPSEDNSGPYRERPPS
jgi:hypothetical protein